MLVVWSLRRRRLEWLRVFSRRGSKFAGGLGRRVVSTVVSPWMATTLKSPARHGPVEGRVPPRPLTRRQTQMAEMELGPPQPLQLAPPALKSPARHGPMEGRVPPRLLTRRQTQVAEMELGPPQPPQLLPPRAYMDVLAACRHGPGPSTTWRGLAARHPRLSLKVTV